MKKIKNLLFILVALLLVVVEVNAADYSTPVLGEDVYKNVWKKAHATEEDEGLYESIVVDDGVVVVGYENVTIVEDEDDGVSYTSSYRGIIEKYNDAGELVWSTKHDSNDIYFYELVEVSDGYVVFGEYYDWDNYNGDYFLIKYSLDGEKVWESLIVEDFEYTGFFKLATYNDLIIVTFGENAYIYDIAGKQVKVLDSTLMYSVATMDKNGIYLVGNKADDANQKVYLTLEKYDYEYNLVATSNLSEAVFDSTTDSFTKLEIVYDITMANDKVVVAVEETTSEVNAIYVLDDELKVAKKVDYETVDYDIYDVEESKDGFVVLLQYTKNSITCTSRTNIVVDERKPEHLRESDCAGTVYVVYKYDMEANKLWEIEVPFIGYGIGSKGVELSVTGYADENVDDFTNVGFYDGYVYKYAGTYNITTKDDGNGTITTNRVEGVNGEEIEFSVTPKEGYKLVKITVTTSDGQTVEYTDYKFTMPSDDVVISAEFEKVPENPNTGLSNPLFIFGSILGVALVGSLVIKKKKFI